MCVIIFLNVYSYAMFFINSIQSIYNRFHDKPSWASKYYEFWQNSTVQIQNKIVTNFSIKLPLLTKYFSFYKSEKKNPINATSVTTEDSVNNKPELVLQNLSLQDIDTLTFEQIITLQKNGNNLLHQAAFNNNVKFIGKILKENLADSTKAYAIMDQTNNIGDTFLDIAYKNKNYSIISEVASIFESTITTQDCTVPESYKHMSQAQYDIGLFLKRKYSNTPEPIDITKLCMPVEYEFYYKIYQDINFTMLPKITEQCVIGDTLKE